MFTESGILDKKISFKSAEEIKALVLDAHQSERVCEIIDSLVCEDDVEYSFASECGTLIVRIFDMGRYSFIFPFPICDAADVAGAVGLVCKYCMAEEIPVLFVGVPSDCVKHFAMMGIRHMDIDADSPKADFYRIRVKSELEMLSEMPESSDGEISLSELDDSDVSDYGTLCRNTDLNKYWGYDFRSDHADISDEELVRLAHSEFDFSTSMSFAVRLGEGFIGEAVFYAFDFLGGADIAIRILPEHHGNGYGRRVLEIALQIAADIGLTVLYASILKENEHSINAFLPLADRCDDVGSAYRLTFTIYGE